MASGQLFQCQECDQEFTLNHNLIRHVNTVHGNEARKDNEARMDGNLKCVDIHTSEDAAVGSDHQVASPAEYVSLAMEATHNHKRLTSDQFLEVTGLSVFQCIRDKFWTLLYKRPDLYVYVTDEMVRWSGFQGESRYKKKT